MYIKQEIRASDIQICLKRCRHDVVSFYETHWGFNFTFKSFI